MKNIVICDTGIISRYLEGETNIQKTIEKTIGLENICITPLNKIELFNWISDYKNLDSSYRILYRKFIDFIPILHINENISKLAIENAKKNINEKPADVFISAIAEYHNIKVYTLNKKHFKKVLYNS